MPPQELLSSQDSEQELLLENFKAAANCLTNLYRNSLNVEKRAKNLGIQYALESVLSWVGEQASTGKQTVSLEELVSFCYQLSDQMGSSEILIST
ncbi:GTPase Obg [Galdieria sulphuraria]|nr:GTPase Obg [Galdieria sulphuraria]